MITLLHFLSFFPNAPNIKWYRKHPSSKMFTCTAWYHNFQRTLKCSRAINGSSIFYPTQAKRRPPQFLLFSSLLLPTPGWKGGGPCQSPESLDISLVDHPGWRPASLAAPGAEGRPAAAIGAASFPLHLFLHLAWTSLSSYLVAR